MALASNRLQSWLSALPPCPLSLMCCCKWSFGLAAFGLAAAAAVAAVSVVLGFFWWLWLVLFP